MRRAPGAGTAEADRARGPFLLSVLSELSERQARIASASLRVFEGRITAAALAGAGW